MERISSELETIRMKTTKTKATRKKIAKIKLLE